MLPPSYDPAQAVFINYPYDARYEALIQAIVLGTVCCGFTPVNATVIGTGADPRIDRILRGLQQTKYSIHDLSRHTGHGADNHARFNMPLELGMAMAMRHLESADHEWLMLVPKGVDVRLYVSDLQGFDAKDHDGTPATVLRRIMSWLDSRSSVPPPPPPRVEAMLPAFASAWAADFANWSELRWWELVEIARDIAHHL